MKSKRKGVPIVRSASKVSQDILPIQNTVIKCTAAFSAKPSKPYQALLSFKTIGKNKNENGI